MKNKHYSLLLATLLVALSSGTALAVTQQEANAQLDRIPAAASRDAAQEVLNTLVSAGCPVDQALKVVNSAVTHNYSATEMRQVGAVMREQMQQKIPVDYVVKTADNAINANYPAKDTVKALNAFQSKVKKGIPAKQAFESVNSDIAGSRIGFGSGTGMGAGGGSGSASSMGSGSGGGMTGSGTPAGSKPPTGQ